MYFINTLENMFITRFLKFFVRNRSLPDLERNP